MTAKTAANLFAAAHWLSAHPDIPEPYAVHGWPNLCPSVMWKCETATEARAIIAAIGGNWSSFVVEDTPRTIASSRPDFCGTTMDLTVTVWDRAVVDLLEPASELGGVA